MKNSALSLKIGCAPLFLVSLIGCGETAEEPGTGAAGAAGNPAAPVAGTSNTSSGAGGSGNGGSSTAPSSAGASTAGVSGSNSPSTGGAPSGSSGNAGNPAQAGSSPGGAAGSVGVINCSEAAAAYTISAASLEAGGVPAARTSGFGAALFAELPLAVSGSGQVYVGFTRLDGTSRSAVIASAGNQPIVVADAVNAGIAATNDGVAVLLFDPNTTVNDRRWAAVKRLTATGTQVFQTDLFRSASLEQLGSKGAPGTSRLGYFAASDQLIAYFGHTELYDDDVRHQGGFLGTLSATGMLSVVNDWFGSHNLDQRLLVEGPAPTVLGLGDAYPEGIFFATLGGNNPRPGVLYPLASAGNGSTNGQLGAMVDLGEEIVVPFITNRSIPQDLDAGTWPDIDEAISSQIRAAAGNGTDLGILRVPRGGTLPMGGYTATFVETSRPDTARLARLKSARYGSGGLILLAWAELTGTGRNPTTAYYTMVIDRDGAVCQPKAELAPEFAFTSGDDLVRGPDGSVLWANVVNGAIQLVTLRPGN